jgi:methylmalonyl-CoA mutase C-terminal domain/subunit
MRVLVAKVGLDGHDRGARLVVRILRDAGHEVIYTGMRQTAETVVAVAEQEDVHVIGVSILSGGHVEIARDVAERLRARDLTDIGLVLGGVIPGQDIPRVLEAGADTVIRPGATIAQIVDSVTRAARRAIA